MVITIPSRGRAGRVSTLKFLPNAKLYVPESEVEQYREKYPNNEIVGVPDAIKGITRTRNYILDHETDDWIVQIDDDIKGFFYWEGGAKFKMHDIEWHLIQSFVLTQDFGFHLWGWGMKVDKIVHQPFAPISTLAVIVGNIMGIIKTGLRFDERLVVKEDYDFALQHLYADGGVFKNNKYFVVPRHWTNSGGCVDYRTHKTEEEAYKILRKKWGKIVKWKSTRNRIQVYPPLRGI